MIVDSHAHINFKAYDKDRLEVIKRCLNNEVKVINVGSQLSTSRLAVEIAQAHTGDMFAAVGFHPVHLMEQNYEETEFQKLIDRAGENIVAVGEIGLDYYRINASNIEVVKQNQKQLFRRQYNQALKNKLPAILHCRDAYSDLIEECSQYGNNQSGVVHCFLGDIDIADAFMNLGFYLGFTGIITFSDDPKLLEVIQKVSLDRMLIETDSPYLTPVPFRGQRNEPLYVKYVAQTIAEIKGLTVKEVVATTARNAGRLFNF